MASALYGCAGTCNKYSTIQYSSAIIGLAVSPENNYFIGNTLQYNVKTVQRKSGNYSSHHVVLDEMGR
jgi:hypothetical protein